MLPAAMSTLGTPINGHRQLGGACLKSATSGHRAQSRVV